MPEMPALLQKMIKQRRESLAIYEKAGRKEQAEQEATEIAVIEEFLPKQMSEAEAKEAIAAAIKETGRDKRQGNGQGDGRPEGALRRPHGLRQGERAGEGAVEVGSRVSALTQPPSTLWKWAGDRGALGSVKGNCSESHKECPLGHPR